VIRKQFYSIIALAFALSLLLLGCQSQPETPDDTASVEEVTVAAVQASPTPLPAAPTLSPPANTPTSAPIETNTATPTPKPSPTNAPAPAPPSLVTTDNLNARSGPGTNFDKIGLLPEGAEVKITGRNADSSWWQIAYPDAPEGAAWVSANYGEASNVEAVPLVELPPTPTPLPPTNTPPTEVLTTTETLTNAETLAPTETPPPAEAASPTPAPAPDASDLDFVVQGYRLWTNEENGGDSPGGSVTNCGYGHNINVMVVDAAGNPLDGVTIGDIYGNTAQISGSKGPGRAEFLIYNGTGWELFIKEYISAGRPVSSEQSPVLGGNASQIPIEMLIAAHYCATVEECQFRTETNALCFSHYSWDITFQRTW